MTRNENGFTLIELLVATVISAIMIAGITGGFLVFIKNSDAATDRLSESHDVQMLAAYFVPDVQTAETAAAARPFCDAGTAPFITLTSPASGATTVTYSLRTVALERQLIRTAGTDITVVSHNVAKCATATHVLDPGIPTVTNCFAGGGSCTTKYLLLTVKDVTKNDPAGFSFTVQGNRRVS